MNAQSEKKPRKFNPKSCLINIVIVFVTLACMLFFGEILFRWLDGYDISSFDLRRDTTIQTTE